MSRLRVMGFDVQQRGIQVAAGALGLFLVMVLALLSQGSNADQRAQTGFAFMVLGIACYLGVWQSNVLCRSLTVAARVLRSRQVPSALWRQWLRTSLMTSCRIWAFILAAALCVMWPSRAPWGSLSALSLVTMVICLWLLAGLAAQGFAHRAWRHPLLALLLIWLVSGQWGDGLLKTIDFFNGAPWGVHLLLCLSLPSLLGWLWIRWSGGPPLEAGNAAINFTAVGPLLIAWYVKRVRPYFQRYTPLGLVAPLPIVGKTPHERSLAWVLYGPASCYFFATMWGHGWGANVALWQLGIFAWIVVMFSNSLICKDLHWRALLAPGALRPGSLATHIVVHSWWLSTLAVGVVAVPIVIGFRWAADMPMALALAQAALQLGTAPIELFFALSVATLVRGLGWNFWQLLTLAFGGVGGVVAGCWLLGLPFKAPLYTVGPAYLAVLAVAGFGALWVANKLWTVERLLQCAPKS
jgi:hypothetical protein